MNIGVKIGLGLAGFVALAGPASAIDPLPSNGLSDNVMRTYLGNPHTPTVGRILGDVRNFGIVPGAPAASTRVANPGTQPWSAASDALFPTSGRWSTVMPGNEFFDLSKYGVNCDNTLPLTLTGGKYVNGGWQMSYSYACKVTAAPVVDMDWVRANLDAKGYTYAIAYPQEDHGNGRALITWSKACWFDWGGGPAFTAYCWRGMARLEGAPEGWQNQYGPATIANLSRPHGSDIQDGQADWPQPYRGTAAAIFAWSDGFSGDVASANAGSIPYLVGVQDDWLGGTPTPPTPPPSPLSVPLAPPAAPPPAGSANPTNSGGPGAASGVGTGTTAAHDEQGAAFQWDAYCRSPNPDGSARPSGWIDNCLATRH